MASAAVFGCTGAVGSHILSTLLTTPSFTSITTISRRLPSSSSSSKLTSFESHDTSQWSDILQTLQPPPDTIFNAVGTTRALAGSIKEQWKIDHDLCVGNVHTAKAAGVKTYIYISSAGTRGWLSRYAPYCQMKNRVEDATRDAGFDHGIVLRPGMIVGRRETSRSIVLETVIGSLHYVSQGLQDLIGQDREVIARAAVAAVRRVQEGTVPKGYWVLEQADIVRLGRDEWQS